MSDKDDSSTDNTQPPDTDKDPWVALTEQFAADGLDPGQVEERLKASRKWEQRARDNMNAAEELAKLRQSSMSDTERAVEQARAEARKEAYAETSERLAAAEVRAALAGVVDDPDAIVEDLNLSRYVTDEGDVDAKAVKVLAEKYAKLTPGKGSADLKQGSRTPSSTPPDGNDWLRQKVSSRQ